MNPTPIIWRTQNDPARDIIEGDLAIIRCEDESLTQQHFTEDADLNVIARRFGINAIPIGPLDPSRYRDTTNDPDLREVLEHQRQAKNDFMGLPAKLRMRFHNSPNELWDFVNDPENAEEAVRLGLLVSPTAPTAESGSEKTPASPKETEHPPKPPTGGPTP